MVSSLSSTRHCRRCRCWWMMLGCFVFSKSQAKAAMPSRSITSMRRTVSTSLRPGITNPLRRRVEKRQRLAFISTSASKFQYQAMFSSSCTTLHGPATVSSSDSVYRLPHHASALYNQYCCRMVSTWLRSSSSSSNSASGSPATRRNDDDADVEASNSNAGTSFYAPSVLDFATMGIKSPILLSRLRAMQLERPSAIQVAAFAALSASSPLNDSDRNDISGDVIIGSETGSGKTLSYLLPLMDDILQRKAAAAKSATKTLDVGYDYARALILVPNKELVQQVVRMALPLAGGPSSLVYGGSTLPDASLLLPSNDDNGRCDSETPPHEMVRLAIMPGGLKEPLDFVPFRQTKALSATGTQPPLDIIISTPAAVAPLGISPKNIAMFADIATIVMDEADLLLDGGYIRPLQDVLLGFRRADRLDPSLLFRAVNEGDEASNANNAWNTKTQHVFVAATLPDSGLRSVDAYLTKRFPYIQRIALDTMHMARHSGLNAQQATVWIELESKKERMQALVRMLLHSDDLKGDKVMVFLNSVEDVEASCQALQRAGVECLPYHAKIPLDERTETLNRFRRYSSHEEVTDGSAISVLVCTDLASRGLDIPGVTAVVQLQFAGNVVSHLHRMGRCGRAMQTTGRGIVFYSAKERALVATVQEAERLQQESSATLASSPRLTLSGDVAEPAVRELDADETSTDRTGGDFSNDAKLRNDNASAAGKVTSAFSRKRGFTKKLKKEVKRQNEAFNVDSDR